MKKIVPILVLFSLLVIGGNSLAISTNSQAKQRIANQLYKTATYFLEKQDLPKAINFFNRSLRINNNDQRFREGLLLSQKELLNKSFTSHENGGYLLALKGYRIISNSLEIDKRLTVNTQRNIEKAKSRQNPVGLEEYKVIGKSLLKKNKPLAAQDIFLEGYFIFPSKQLLAGVEESSRAVLSWSVEKHQQGNLEQAITGYDRLLNDEMLKNQVLEGDLTNQVKRMRKYASLKYTPQDLLNQAAVAKEKSFKEALNLYRDGLLLYPKFNGGVFQEEFLQLAKTLFDNAKNQHLKANFKAASLGYREIIDANLGSASVNDPIFSLSKAKLELAEKNLPFEIKVAYLTFDDGPSLNTEKILNILSKYQIKATFFVTGNNSDYAKSLYRRIVREGHVLGNHTYSHNYAHIYSSLDAFKEDFLKLEDLLVQTVGIKPRVIRYPGGSNNISSHRYGGKDLMKSILAEMNKLGYTHFDWNVDSRDASKIKEDTGVIISSVLSSSTGKDMIIVLMHDSLLKTTTVEALPTIIEGLIEQGYVFKTLTPVVTWQGNFAN